MEECFKALNAGVDLHGVCLYPFVDVPDWWSQKWAKIGIYDVADKDSFERVPCDAYIEELRRWQKLLDQPENVEPDGYGHRWGRVQLAEVRRYAAEWAGGTGRPNVGRRLSVASSRRRRAGADTRARAGTAGAAARALRATARRHGGCRPSRSIESRPASACRLLSQPGIGGDRVPADALDVGAAARSPRAPRCRHSGARTAWPEPSAPVSERNIGFLVPLGHFDQHVGERAIFVMAHRDGRPVEIPLVVRVEVEPDHVDQRAVAAQLRLGHAEDPVIGLVHALKVRLGGPHRPAAAVVRARCEPAARPRRWSIRASAA